MDLVTVTTTVGSAEEARRIARTLVERRLVACVHLLPVESVYRWEGALQQEGEWRLEAKTIAARWPQVEAAIRALHPYALPDIHAVALAGVHAAYAAWVAAEVAAPVSPGEPPGGTATG